MFSNLLISVQIYINEGRKQDCIALKKCHKMLFLKAQQKWPNCPKTNKMLPIHNNKTEYTKQYKNYIKKLIKSCKFTTNQHCMSHSQVYVVF